MAMVWDKGKTVIPQTTKQPNILLGQQSNNLENNRLQRQNAYLCQIYCFISV